jgi:methionine S-methyltransferase
MVAVNYIIYCLKIEFKFYSIAVLSKVVLFESKIVSLLSSVDRFLERCSRSSGDAFAAFSELLAILQSPSQTQQARQFCTSVYQAWNSEVDRERYYFSFVTQSIETADLARRELLLLLFPSIFAPEEWSLTFYEGLFRYSSTEFYGRQIVELGCGSGWISLAVALHFLPKVIYGVDLNPRAVVCSQLNLYLNAFDDLGEPIFDREGQILLDRVKFAESNLLEYFKSFAQPLDRVIGCIPQVLNPELSVMQDLVKYATNDRFLHSLSNYCEKQGYVEDRFGLGLLAKAIEQSIQLLRPTGKVIFNFGGRPGASVLERLMTRRGLTIRLIWQTRVEQDPDTDISSLVEIERATAHRFEFFMTLRSDTPICAATAEIYSRQGGKIFHTVSVYEGILAYPSWLKQIFAILQPDEFQQVKSALDLTEIDPDVAEERCYWLASLLGYLNSCPYFPYGLTAGELALRERVATYFRNYHSIPWQLEDLIITPSRQDTIANLLSLYEPDMVVIDNSLLNLIPAHWQETNETKIIASPRRIKLLTQLMTTLKPALVITGLSPFEIASEEPFASLVETAQSIGALLIVDISDNLNLSSHPSNNGLFEYLSEHQLPENTIILADLIKNRLYRDLSLCINAISSANLRQDLIRAAELTYSRVSGITQFFYQQLLEQLLHFQTPRLHPHANYQINRTSPFNLQRSACASQAFTHPAIVGNELPFTESSIRLDYGENCLPTPLALKLAIAEAFARQEISVEECAVNIPLSALLAKRYQINFIDRQNFLYGEGVADLFNTVIQQCRREQGSFIFPQGAYGNFRATLDFYGIAVTVVATKESENFKLDLDNLAASLATIDRPWLYLNAPLSNPTGALYSSQELQQIVELAWRYKARVVLDTIFSGLEFNLATTQLDWSWMQDRRKHPGSLILLGGIAKEFAAAGIRFGYLYSPDKLLVGQLARLMPRSLPQSIMYAMTKFYDRLAKGDGDLEFARQSQSHCLQQRANRLTEVLESCGWKVIPPQGGLFLVAKPIAFLGKTLSNRQDRITIDGDNIATILFDRVGLTINNATWTGLPDYCRFVFSVSETEFETGLDRIKQFFQAN